MFIGVIRLIETQTVEVVGESLEAVHAQLDATRPEGFDLVKAPVSMGKVAGAITATGTFARRDQTREITAATREELKALVPDGWQLLHAREA